MKATDRKELARLRKSYLEARKWARKYMDVMESCADQYAKLACPVEVGDVIQFGGVGPHYAVEKIYGMAAPFDDARGPRWYAVVRSHRAHARPLYAWNRHPGWKGVKVVSRRKK